MEVKITIDFNMKDLLNLIVAVISLITAIVNYRITKKQKNESPSPKKGNRK